MHSSLLVVLSCALFTALAAEPVRDLEFARPGGVPLTLDAWTPSGRGPHPAVILVHGGGWEAGDKTTYIRPWFPLLSEAGFAWFSINYRLAPAHRHPAALEDVEAAVGWVRANARRFGIDTRRLALMGESAGGHLAALAGVRGKVPVRAVVSFYGIHDIGLWATQRGGLPRNLAQYLGAADWDAASPVTYIGRRMPAFLFIHGTQDAGVPIAQSTTMCERMRAAGAACEVYAVEGAGHGVENWEKNPAWLGYKAKLAAWLRATLR
jgi:alpha-L-fucosidase 2